MLANPASFDVAVTTYDMMHSADLGRALCRTIHWRYLVLDEGHKIKNEHTLVSQSMRHTRRARMRGGVHACPRSCCPAPPAPPAMPPCQGRLQRCSEPSVQAPSHRFSGVCPGSSSDQHGNVNCRSEDCIPVLLILSLMLLH